ncbi:Protein of unknown function DUF1640 [Penicillium capsulatum]|nr:Protein of unknown function DUF1640 [Penicillium capsulatum]
MTAPRLPFLYPNLMRAVRSRRHEQETYQRRYGPAVEPNLPPPSRPKGQVSPPETELEPNETEGDEPAAQNNLELSQPDAEGTRDHVADAAGSSLSEQVAANATIGGSGETDQRQANEAHPDNSESSPEFIQPANAGEEMSQMPPYANHSAFDDVYHMPSPSTYLTPTGPSPGDKPPHLSPAPYVHHFDTYSLVLDLSRGGFSNPQSVTIMKAVRSILQRNIDYAKQSLTSKSDVENESYLFKAACSELQQSLQTARNSEVQRQRASRTQLEHESDILSQRTNQELAGMKDDIKGMFNDHKMATREQQRTIDTSVQELNYKITVSLNSDGKSEIEGLRWILTRRAALTVATCAFMIIVFLKYASTRKVHEPAKIKEVEKPVVAKEAVTETRVVHDVGARSDAPVISEAHLGESLG